MRCVGVSPTSRGGPPVRLMALGLALASRGGQHYRQELRRADLADKGEFRSLLWRTAVFIRPSVSPAQGGFARRQSCPLFRGRQEFGALMRCVGVSPTSRGGAAGTPYGVGVGVEGGQHYRQELRRADLADKGEFRSLLWRTAVFIRPSVSPAQGGFARRQSCPLFRGRQEFGALMRCVGVSPTSRGGPPVRLIALGLASRRAWALGLASGVELALGL